MKKLLLATTALLGLTAGALAADLPSRRAPAPFVAVPVFTWTGFYVGVNAGYGFSDSNNNNSSVSFPTGSILNSAATNLTVNYNNNINGNRDGFIGGGQVGYNYQFGQFVIGLEADGQYVDFGRRRNNLITPANYTIAPGGTLGLAFSFPPANIQFSGNRSMDFLGTVRGRVGYAFDRVLVYGTGGLAYNEDDLGFAAGGGVEYAFTPNLSAKVEGLYVSLDRGRNNGQTTFDLPSNTVFVGGNARNNNFDFAVVRAGLNYRFNGF